MADQTPQLLVVDRKGCVVHVTTRLTSRLGTTVASVQASGTIHALESLLPLPFARLHRGWAHDTPEAVQPWSCRSGLSIFLQARGTEGPYPVPFSMQMNTKVRPLNKCLGFSCFGRSTEGVLGRCAAPDAGGRTAGQGPAARGALQRAHHG